METQVLIVGAGPTGLVLALWLSQFGIPIRIIDKDKTSGETSRAMGVQARTLEFYQQIGLAEEVVSKGIIAHAIHLRVLGVEKAHGNLGEMGTGLSPFPFMLTFPQDDHEKVLLEQLSKKGVTVERQTELLRFSENGDNVQATLKTPNGDTETIVVPYLCGCDGARSTVRTQFKMDFHGGTYSQLFFVADAKATGEAASGDLQLCLSENDFCMVMPVRSSGTFRIIGEVPDLKVPQENITFKDVSASVARNTKLKIEAINWFSTYHVHHRVARHFRVGNVFLAGDAAHIHSPVGGQGMNTGISDAINLAWKIAAVVQQRAGKAILATYEVERKAFALQLVSTTDKLFQIMTHDGTLGQFWRMTFFPFMMSKLLRITAVKRFIFKTISQIKINYRHSALSKNALGKLHSGDRLPWVDYGDKDNFSALQTLDWQVHIYGDADATFTSAVAALGLKVVVFPSTERSAEKGLQKNAVYCIRPDGYLGFVDATQNSENLKNYLVAHQIVARG